MTMYATGNAFQSRNSLSHLQDLEVYRHEAESLARRAALAGDIEALLALSMAYAPQHAQTHPSLLAQATGADPVEELSMLLLAQKYGATMGREQGHGLSYTWNARSLEEAIAAVRERVDTEQTLRAEQLAAQRRTSQLIANPVQKDAFDDNRLPFVDDIERARCDSEAFAPVAPSPASG